MTQAQTDIKQRIQEVNRKITKTIEEANEGLLGMSDLQLVALEGLADTNEQQTIGSIATFAGLADLVDIMLDLSDIVFAIADKLGV